jgi:hypothetical protein
MFFFKNIRFLLLPFKSHAIKKQFVENDYYGKKWFEPSAKVNPFAQLPSDFPFQYRLSVVGFTEQVISVLTELIGAIIEQPVLKHIIVHLLKLNVVFCRYEKISKRKVTWVSMERLRFIVK